MIFFLIGAASLAFGCWQGPAAGWFMLFGLVFVFILGFGVLSKRP